MDVYIGGIPATTTLADLMEMFGSVIGKPRLRLVKQRDAGDSGYSMELLKGVARVVRIRMHKNLTQSDASSYFLVASFTSDRLARRVIRRMDGQELPGGRVEVRPYYPRDPKTDRRAKTSNCCWISFDRRKGERREGEDPGLLEIKGMAVKQRSRR